MILRVIGISIALLGVLSVALIVIARLTSDQDKKQVVKL